MPTTTSTITGTTPTAGGTDLTAQAAAQNIASAPSIDTLTQLIQGINQKAYLSAPGRTQELGTIEDMLSGKLSYSKWYEEQLKGAQGYGAGGFSADSPAWQTAIQRGLGLDTEALVGAGQKAMDAFYAGMPVANAQAQMTTPALLEQQQATQGAQALTAQEIANQQAQFTAAQAQQLSEFGTTSAQNQAKLYASIYGSLPGYNEYGQYTGQTGTFPYSAFANAGAGTGTGTGTTGAAGNVTTPQSALAAFDAGFTETPFQKYINFTMSQHG